MKQASRRSAAEDRALLEELHGNPSSDAMSPHDRVQLAISLQEPDRVPFDFWAVPEVIERLRGHLSASNDEEMLRLLGVDCRVVEPDYVGPQPLRLDDGSFFDVWGAHRRIVSTEYGTYQEHAGFPLAEATSRLEVETWTGWPRTEYWDWDSVVAKIKALNADVRYHVRYQVGGIFEAAWKLYGLDRFLVGLLQSPSVPCAIMDCYTSLYIANVRSLLEAANGQVDLLYTYDDIATQSGLLMSPDMWHEFIRPHHVRLNSAIKEYGVKIMYHSCGAILPMIRALVEQLGIDVLNPLQPRASGMVAARIKQEYGSRLAFHGAIDIQETLPHGSPSDVQAEVRERCRTLGKGGGYICCSSHNIQGDTPVENIIAMYTAARTVDAPGR